jgi:peptide/nickel transport system permease protein
MLSAVVGTAFGLVAGTLRALDNVLMRVMDVLMAFPVLIMAIAIVAFFGSGARNVTIALAIAFIPLFARVARASTLAIVSQPYVLAARSIGDRPLVIAVREILPNALPAILAQAALATAYAILGESALSFLGLSVQPPKASWGSMLADGRDFLQTSPHLAAVPGAMITVVVIGFNLLGDALRDFLDPQLRDRVR